VRAYLAVAARQRDYAAHLNRVYLLHAVDNNGGVLSQILQEAREQVGARDPIKDAGGLACVGAYSLAIGLVLRMLLVQGFQCQVTSPECPCAAFETAGWSVAAAARHP
jgi:hypothetical protein